MRKDAKCKRMSDYLSAKAAGWLIGLLILDAFFFFALFTIVQQHARDSSSVEKKNAGRKMCPVSFVPWKRERERDPLSVR